jgi:replicative DNA helicase
MAKETYQFAESFQQRIAAMCLRDPSFLQDYHDVVNPSYFDHDYISSIVRVAMNCVDQYREVPSRDTMVEEIRRYSTAYKVDAADTQAVVDRLGDIYRINVTDPESVKQNVIRFGKRQAMKAAVIKVADMIDNESEYDKALDIVTRALSTGNNVNQLGMKMFGQFSTLHTLDTKHGPTSSIPTMFPQLDQAIVGNNGPSRGEVWIVMGMPGKGKSQFLVNIGSVAVLNGFNVVHVTIADLRENDVGYRYGARMTFHTIGDVIKGEPSYIRKAEKLDQYTGRYLRVKYWPAATVTIASLRAYLSRLVTEDGIRPDLIIVDYPDEFKATTDNDYQNMGNIYGELNAIAYEYDALVWAASQVRRWTPSHPLDVIKMDNIADSWRKAAKADGIVSFNQTPVEKKWNSGRMYVDKVRRGRSMFTVHLRCDMERCYMREKTQQEIDDESENISAEIREESGKGRRKTGKDTQSGGAAKGNGVNDARTS